MEKNLYTPDEPIAAIATALAPAALGIVRTSGKNCVELVAQIFSRPDALRKAEGNTIIYGWLMRNASATESASALARASASAGAEASADALASASGAAQRAAPSENNPCERTQQEQIDGGRIDEVLVSVFRAPKSFTGEEMAEISCHGGPAVVQAVYNALLANGFRAAEKGEFTFRAFINGKTDLTRAEAVREIIESKSDISRGHAAGRLAGSVYAEIERVKKLLVDTLAAIEVSIEYPEDEETIADSFDSEQLVAAEASLRQLVDSWQSEKLYQDGARVVLCGRTNAGKSSLFNELLKEERAIVSNIPGTTRDWLESWTSFRGIPVRLFDTAGLRETDDVIEKQGVELTRSLTEDADVVIYLCDVNEGLADDDCEFLDACEKPVIFAWNKCDGESAVIAGVGSETNTVVERDAGEGAMASASIVASAGASPSDVVANAGSSGNFVTSEKIRALANVSKAGDLSSEKKSASANSSFSSVLANGAAVTAISISAKTGRGIGKLIGAVCDVLTSGGGTKATFDVTAGGDALVEAARTVGNFTRTAALGSARQKSSVSEALERVTHALSLVASGDDYTMDAIVQDLEDAVFALGEVTGAVTSDDILDSVFSNFCVGK